VIIRTVRERVREGREAEYEALLREAAASLLHGSPGLMFFYLCRPVGGNPSEFGVVSLWRDLDSLQAFAGKRWRESVLTPELAELVEESRVEHLEVLERPKTPKT
jgi:heme-degrading monooxygenase HmoA